MKKIFLITALAIGFVTANAQINIGGKINGTTAANLPVYLLKTADSSLVKAEQANGEGNFMFNQVPNGSYLVHVVTDKSTIYTTPIAQTNTTVFIDLKPTNNNLEGIKVVAKKPVIEMKADKLVFNVEASINSTGSNALELLRKSPGVTVDKDENIALRGKNAVRIYIDGKPSYLDNKDLTAMLKSMQASDLEAIEMITNPGSKYDASGNAGIINIKIKKNKKFGTNGTISAGYAIGTYSKYNADLSLNHRNKKVNVFGTYGINKSKNLNVMNFKRTQNGVVYDQHSENIDNSLNNNFKVGADYFVNNKSTFGVLANVMLRNSDFTGTSRAPINAVGQPINQVLVATNAIPGSNINSNFNVNYKYEDTSGKTFNIDADYGFFNSVAKSYQPNFYKSADEQTILFTNIYRNSTPTAINIYAIKADYEQNLWKGKVGFGGKTAIVNTDNDFKFYDVLGGVDLLNENRSNHFNYNENVNALYVNYARQLNKKWSTNAGLRMENTNSTGILETNNPQPTDSVIRGYTDFFPSASIGYTPNSKHMFNLAYSRRIDRPNYQDLNPFENKLDELSYQKGNAFLRPQYTHNVELNYTLFQFISMGASYANTKDLFMEITDTTEQSKTYITQKNFGRQQTINFNIGAPLPIRKWWNGYTSINYSYIMLDANFDNRIINNNYGNFNIYLNNDFTLKKDWSASIGGWFNGPSYWGGIFKTKSMGSLDIGVQKQLMNKRLTLRAGINDIFYSAGWRAVVNFGGMDIIGNGNYESRRLVLNATYRFGGKEVSRARQRETGASKEADRIKSK